MHFSVTEVLALTRLCQSQRIRQQYQFLMQFFGENFIFDGEIQSMILFRLHVERDLTGSASIALFSQTLREIQDHEQKWGERPEPVGALELKFRNGKPMVDVTKFNTAPGAPSKWTNRNKFA